MEQQIVEWAFRLVVLVGLASALYLLKALKATVNAQKETINAQSKKMAAMETFLTTMEAVLKSTDEQTMLARLEAHKKFVDHEKEALERRFTSQFEEEKTKAAGSQQNLERAYSDLAGALNALVDLAANTLPYVPKVRRSEFINAIDLEFHFYADTKQFLTHIAETAPDLTAPAITFGGEQPSLSRLTGFDTPSGFGLLAALSLGGPSAWTVGCIHCEFKKTDLTGQQKDAEVVGHELANLGHKCAVVGQLPD